MGIDAQGAAFLGAARASVSYETTVTLGRQAIHTTGRVVNEALSRVGCSTLPTPDRWAESFLRALGAERVESLDVSAFEGATIEHDLNLALPSALVGSFSAVIDGGTLEHVFDFAAALRHATDLVALGGHYLAITPCNNAAGHGFYQLSPELYWRALSAENGFAVERMLLGDGRRWFAVPDPAVLGRRTEFATRRVSYLYVAARRTSVGPWSAVFQSDYESKWADQASVSPSADRDRARAIGRACRSWYWSHTRGGLDPRLFARTSVWSWPAISG